MTDRFQRNWTIVFIAILILCLVFIIWAEPTCADTSIVSSLPLVMDTDNRTYVLQDSLSTDSIGVFVRCSACSLRSTVGENNVIVYGTNGGKKPSSGAFLSRWNPSGTGLVFDVYNKSNIVIKNVRFRCGITDTSWGTDSANAAMSGIAEAGNIGVSNVEIESVSVYVWTANSHGIYFNNGPNIYIHDGTIYDSVRVVGHNDQLAGTAIFIETPAGGPLDTTVVRKMRVLGCPALGIGIGKVARTPTHYTKIEQCYVDGGNYWNGDGKWKNAYAYGAANWNKYDTAVGTGRAMILQFGDADRRDADVESCYFAMHGRAERCNAPLSGCAPNPGINWLIKVQTYGGAAAKATIKNNVFKAYCDSVSGSGQGAYGNMSVFSIDGAGVWADIYNNICTSWTFKDSTNTLFNGAGAIPGAYGYYAACLAMNEGENNYNDSIRIWGNTFVTNNRATSFGWHLDGAVDSQWVGRVCSLNTFVRWDTLHGAGTYQPKYYTAHLNGGCQGIRILDAAYQGGASSDSVYLQSGATLEFVTSSCGPPPVYGQKLGRLRIKR